MDRYDQIIDAGTAENTKKAHIGDLRYFWAWAGLDAGISESYPVEARIVVKFITDHLSGLDPAVDRQLVAAGIKAQLGPHAVTTINRRVSSLSHIHELKKMHNPCRSQAVRILMIKARSAASKSGNGPKKKRAITAKLLEQMLATFGQSLKDKRDRAILLFAFASGGRRRSEVAAAKIENLDPVRGGFIYTIPRSKTDQEGKGRPVPVRGLAAKVLNSWLEASGITFSYIFRQVRGDRILKKPVGANYVNRLVKERVAACGRDPRHYGAHSLRSGFMTEAGRQRVSLGDAMALSGHKTAQVALGYYQAGNIFENPASNLI